MEILMDSRRIVLVDDEVEFVEDLRVLIQALGYDSEAYYSLASAKEGLRGREDDFIVLLDHDFRAEAGEDEKGYLLARWLRREHRLREILPIIYLTGRESPEDFVKMHQELRLFAPDAYLNKSQLASEPDRLPELLSYYDDELDRFQAMREEYGDERARYFFYELYYG
jgi:CheY-like chemotaxis protein